MREIQPPSPGMAEKHRRAQDAHDQGVKARIGRDPHKPASEPPAVKPNPNAKAMGIPAIGQTVEGQTP